MYRFSDAPSLSLPLRKRRRRKTGAAIAWACAILLGAEGAVRLRALWLHGSAGPVAGIYQTDENLGRRPRPGATLFGSRRSLHINQWGFRGPALPLDKPLNTIRIAAIGGSTTFGLEASSDETVWVSRMAQILNHQQPRSHEGPKKGVLGPRDQGVDARSDLAPRSDAPSFDRFADSFESINAGVPGYTLQASIRHFEERVLPFQPDIVVVCSVAVDIAAHARRQARAAMLDPSTRSGWAAALADHSLLLNLIRTNSASFVARHLQHRRLDKLDQEKIEDYVRKLEELITLCRARDIDLILCTAARAFGDPAAPADQWTLAQSALAHNPLLSLAGLNDAYERYNDAIRRTAEQFQIGLVDLDKAIPKQGEYFADAVHFNDAGHAAAAAAVARVIRSRQPDVKLAQGRDEDVVQ